MKRINQNNFFPTKKWAEIEITIKQIGENDIFDLFSKDLGFLISLELIKKNSNYKLSDIGKLYFEEVFIKGNLKDGEKLLFGQLLNHPPACAIQQYLYGVKNPSISQVITVLKTTGFWQEKIKITHYLDLLNNLKIITYNRKAKAVKVLVQPNTEKIPSSIFIDPKRPYSNILWTKKIISNCNEYIYWLDKHFQKEAFEWIFSSANANKINTIKILSLALSDIGKSTKKEFNRLKEELANKGITIKWQVIDSKKIRDSHDRWIISKDEARNIPNVNAISSGQRSELNLSQNKEDLKKAFLEYWKFSKEIQ